MEVSRHWRLKEQRYNLVGEVCPHCNFAIFPPRDICPSCGDQAKDMHKFSGRGEVYSYTVVRSAPAGFESQTPYPIALIKLDEGPMVTAQLTDMGEKEPEIGMPVEMVTRRLREDGDRGMLIYGYKFRPIIEGAISVSRERSR